MGWSDKLGATGSVSPDELRKLLEELKENEEWKSAITSNCLSYFLLRNKLNQTFSQQSKEVENLFDCSMKQKAKFAYAIGLIDKTTLSDLVLINDIRNEFSHCILYISFADPEVKNKCKGLSTAKGHKVKADNCYEIYKNAVNQCLKKIISAKIRQKQEEKVTIGRQIRKSAYLGFAL